MDKPTLDRLSQINDDLVEHLKWLLERKDLDARAKLIPIVDRLTQLLIDTDKRNPVSSKASFQPRQSGDPGKATWSVNIGLTGSTAREHSPGCA